MKRRRAFNPIIVFIFAQLAWFALLGLWIYWYVLNYMIFIAVGEKISPQFVFSTKNIAPLVGGIVLLVTIAIAMVLIFSRLNEQIKVTKLYDNLIANVSHELKSPLASIQLYLETLSSRDVPRERRNEFITLMTKDTLRLSGLINTILEISQLDEKKKVLDQKIFNAESLIYTLLEEAAEQYNLPPESMQISGNASCNCRVDRGALKVVLNNLFDNAIKYSVGPVRLTITLNCSPRLFIIQVKDRGVGIPDKHKKEIFKKFRRLYNPDSLSVKGTGLGLYWVREIIHLHHGSISVRSEGKNKGSNFRIELPIVNPEGKSAWPKKRQRG